MPDRRLGRIIRCLWLRDVDDRAAHAADKHHRPLGLALHQVLGYGDGEEVGPVHVDAPQLLHPLVWVRYGVVVLSEARGGHEVVDLAMVRDNLADGLVDGGGLGNVGVVGGDFGNSVDELEVIRYGGL